MKNKETKLAILSQMIQMAKADQVIKKSEYSLIVGISNELGVSKADLDMLFRQKSLKLSLHTKEERIIQFHRLILLMGIDQEQHRLEVERLKIIGLGLGLKPSLILSLLAELDNYPDGMVPVDVLLAISKQKSA